MFNPCYRFYKNTFWFLGIFLWSQITTAQLLEIDFTSEKREESSFRIHLIRTGIIGASSLKHLDLTAEILKIRYDSKVGFYSGLTVFGTQTLWVGNKIDSLNTFDFLMNPIGGTIHGNLFNKIPIKRSSVQNSNMGISMGIKWIQGPGVSNFKSTNFLDHYLKLGWVYQRLLAEDALTNSRLSFWMFPHFQIHLSSAESRQLFFNEQIDPTTLGYGMELGLAYNTQLKVTFHGQQLLNANPQSEFNQFVARLSVAYRFLK